jgi:ABC-type multidrug transport system fused ATPase/permease subunit
MFGKKKKKQVTEMPPAQEPQIVSDGSNGFISFDNVSYSYELSYDEDEDGKNAETGDEIRDGKRYVKALENVDLTINSGEFIAVIGRNGSGKSTLAKLMNALLIPSEGTLIVDGIDTSREEMEWEIRSRVGMVFQNPDNQIIGASVEEDIAFGLENIGVPRPEMVVRVKEAAETVGLGDYEEDIQVFRRRCPLSVRIWSQLYFLPLFGP